jgi:hypothetical protein
MPFGSNPKQGLAAIFAVVVLLLLAWLI